MNGLSTCSITRSARSEHLLRLIDVRLRLEELNHAEGCERGPLSELVAVTLESFGAVGEDGDELRVGFRLHGDRPGQEYDDRP